MSNFVDEQGRPITVKCDRLKIAGRFFIAELDGEDVAEISWDAKLQRWVVRPLAHRRSRA